MEFYLVATNKEARILNIRNYLFNLKTEDKNDGIFPYNGTMGKKSTPDSDNFCTLTVARKIIKNHKYSKIPKDQIDSFKIKVTR